MNHKFSLEVNLFFYQTTFIKSQLLLFISLYQIRSLSLIDFSLFCSISTQLRTCSYKSTPLSRTSTRYIPFRQISDLSQATASSFLRFSLKQVIIFFLKSLSSGTLRGKSGGQNRLNSGGSSSSDESSQTNLYCILKANITLQTSCPGPSRTCSATKKVAAGLANASCRPARSPTPNTLSLSNDIPSPATSRQAQAGPARAQTAEGLSSAPQYKSFQQSTEPSETYSHSCKAQTDRPWIQKQCETDRELSRTCATPTQSQERGNRQSRNRSLQPTVVERDPLSRSSSSYC